MYSDFLSTNKHLVVQIPKKNELAQKFCFQNSSEMFFASLVSSLMWFGPT
jgi:hypothetical protein